MFETEDKGLKQIKYLIEFIVFVAIIAVLKNTREIFIPLFLSFFIFMILSPLTGALSKKNFPSFAIVLICLLLFLAVFLVIGFFVGNFASQIVDRLPYYEHRVASINRAIDNLVANLFDKYQTSSFVQSIRVPWASLIGNWVSTISSMTASIAKSILMVFLMLFFLLLERTSVSKKILVFSKNFESDQTYEQRWELINKQLADYIKRKLIAGSIIGLGFYLEALFLKIDFPGICAFSGLVLNFIPTVGSIVAILIISFFALIKFFPQMGICVLTIVLAIGIEVITLNVFKYLKANYLNLSGFFVILSLVFWNYIWGPVGLFIAIPLNSILQMIMANIPRTMPIAQFMSKKAYKRGRDSENETDSLI